MEEASQTVNLSSDELYKQVCAADITDLDDYFKELKRAAEEKEQKAINYIDSPFPHPWWSPYDSNAPKPKTLDEWSVVDIVNDIKQKPNWAEKFCDESIRNKWVSEIKSQLKPLTVSVDVLLKLIFGQIEWELDQETKITPFRLIVDDRIVISDLSIDKNVQETLIEQVNELKDGFRISDNIDEEILDYHPGTNKQVIDLVHPSLYPLQYGVTPVYDDSKELVIHPYDSARVLVKNVNEWGESRNFQWLPSVFKYNPDLKKFEIKSYINNLHPIKYKSIYDTIEKVFTSVIPGLSHVLSLHGTEQYLRIGWEGYAVYTQEYYDGLKKIFANSTDGYDSDEVKAYEKDKLQKLRHPSITYERPSMNVIDVKKFDELKVITKLADIELTPENSKYSGGSWHVEGTISEDVVATIIYYYDLENITESNLSFRSGFGDPVYEQEDTEFCKKIYGLSDEDPMNKVLGSIEAKNNRVLIFPNIFQHKVEPFELVDKTKKGFRRIMAFFIVDPYNKNVISTERVPIQQKLWWNEKELISSEIKDKIKQLNKDLPQSLKQVKEIREKLMKERSLKVDLTQDYDHPYERVFSLCEH